MKNTSTKFKSAKVLALALCAVGFSQAYAQGSPEATSSTYGAGSPTSSLSLDAQTPRANPNGNSLQETVVAFARTQAGTSPKPANAGAINPNNSGTITLNPPLPN